jgi:FdhE protein
LEEIKNAEATAIEKRIKKIKQERSSYIPLLSFFQKVLSAQISSSPHITIDENDVRADLARTKIQEGFPLLRKEKIKADLESAQELFQTLCQIAERENKELEDAVKRIREALKNERLHLRELLEGWVKEKESLNPELASLNLPLLTLLVRCSLQPSLQIIASRLKHLINEDLWGKGYCPICGSLPFLSELRGEGGERIFFCSYCSHEWKGRRLCCPFCENTDSNTLRYLYLEKQGEYRIDLCDKCKRYIKTVDTRKLEGPIIPEVEDIATIHLDILAEEDGFQGSNPLIKLLFQPTQHQKKDVTGGRNERRH